MKILDNDDLNILKKYGNFNKSKTQSKWNLIIVEGLKVKFSDKDLTSCYRNSGSMPVPKQFIPKPKSKSPNLVDKFDKKP